MTVNFAGGVVAECIIDTGFDGALMLPRALITRLGFPVVGRLIFQAAGGALVGADVALAEVEWLSEERTFEVILSEGEDSLLGTEMLDGVLLRIDYAARTVVIDKAD